MRIGICYGGLKWQEATAALLQSYEKRQGIQLSVKGFGDRESLMQYSGLAMHILIMNIEIKWMCVIDDGCKINEKWPDCQIVYFAKDLTHISDVYRSHHLYFVLAKQFNDRLNEIVYRAYQQLGNIKKNIIFNAHGKEQIIFTPEELIYFEREKRNTRIISTRGEFVTSESLDSLIERLPVLNFVRCHHSYIVYLPAVDRYIKNSFLMKNKKLISISRGYRKSTEKAFQRWMKMQVL